PLRFGAVAGLPRFHRSVTQRLGTIWNRQIVIDRDEATKAAAGRTRADGMIEAKQRRRRLLILKIALRAMKLVGKKLWGCASHFGVRLAHSSFRAIHPMHRQPDRKSTRLNSSHSQISYAVFCLKKKT